MIAVVNFTPVQRDGYRIGVPQRGAYLELLNSDAEVYGGANVGNGGIVFDRADRRARLPAVAAADAAGAVVPVLKPRG